MCSCSPTACRVPASPRCVQRASPSRSGPSPQLAGPRSARTSTCPGRQGHCHLPIPRSCCSHHAPGLLLHASQPFHAQRRLPAAGHHPVPHSPAIGRELHLLCLHHRKLLHPHLLPRPRRRLARQEQLLQPALLHPSPHRQVMPGPWQQPAAGTAVAPRHVSTAGGLFGCEQAGRLDCGRTAMPAG